MLIVTKHREGTELCNWISPHLPHQWAIVTPYSEEIVMHCAGRGDREEIFEEIRNTSNNLVRQFKVDVQRAHEES